MGKIVAKTVTAAPRKQAKILITIKLKSTGRPIRGVHGLLIGTDSSGKTFTRGLARSDGLGRFRFVQDIGNVEIQLRHPNHAGEGLPSLPSIPDVTVVFSGTIQEGNHEFEVTMIQIRTQVTVIVTEDPGGRPIGGAKVSVGSESGMTDHRGRYVTKALNLGKKHRFTLTRNGYGPAPGGTLGPVDAEVDLTGLTEVADRDLPLKMRNIWGKVKSGDILVEGDAFHVWFAKFASRFPARHPTLTDGKGNAVPTFPFAVVLQRNNGVNFVKLFDDLGRWFDGGELTIEEFVAIFMIVSNETGGTYKPISEVGSLAYMFYLNKGPNRLAGDQLAEQGLLTDKNRIIAWNKKGQRNFPGVGTDGITQTQLEECDFWKYRGRGFVQTTLRTLYIDRVDPVLKSAGLKISEDLTSTELDDAVLNNVDVYYPLLKNEIFSRRNTFARVNGEDWKGFGYAVAGATNHSYAALYEWRCQELYKDLRRAAEAGNLQLR